jgi:hypothetical protein
MDDTADPPEISVTGGNATLMSSAGGTGTLQKTGSGNLYIGASSWLSVGGFDVTTGQVVVCTGGQLTANAGAFTNGVGQPDDGHITVWAGAALYNQGGAVTCSSLNILGTLQSAGGTLTVTGNVTNCGVLRLLGNTPLDVSGAFDNSGTLDIMTWSGTLPPGFVNDGVLLDRGAIKVESCAVAGGDFNVTIMGYAGHTYQLQYSNGLSPATWTNVGAAQAGTGASLVLTQANGMAAGQRFYRVAVDAPSDSN